LQFIATGEFDVCMHGGYGSEAGETLGGWIAPRK
jgi:hypothetical protein